VSVTDGPVLMDTRGVIYQYTGPPKVRLADVCNEAAGTQLPRVPASGRRHRGGIEYNSPLCLGVGSMLHEHTRTEQS